MNFAQLKKLVIPEGEVKQIEVGGNVLWKSGYTNQVPLSTDTNGSIFNSIGYQEGYRLSSSGALKVQTNSVVTGFMPANRNAKIRMSGVSWVPTPSEGYCYITFYDENFTLLATLNEYRGGTSNGVSNIGNRSGTLINTDKSKSNIKTIDGVTTFNIAFQTGDFSYIRISAEGKGSNMIVTINEDIV